MGISPRVLQAGGDFVLDVEYRAKDTQYSTVLQPTAQSLYCDPALCALVYKLHSGEGDDDAVLCRTDFRQGLAVEIAYRAQ